PLSDGVTAVPIPCGSSQGYAAATDFSAVTGVPGRIGDVDSLSDVLLQPAAGTPPRRPRRARRRRPSWSRSARRASWRWRTDPARCTATAVVGPLNGQASALSQLPQTGYCAVGAEPLKSAAVQPQAVRPMGDSVPS